MDSDLCLTLNQLRKFSQQSIKKIIVTVLYRDPLSLYNICNIADSMA